MTLTVLPPVLAPAQVSQVLATTPQARLLDVRTPGEYDTAHIAGAYNVPLDTLAEHAREVRSVEAPVILVCQSGQRARRAEEVLRRAGMANLHVLDGGMQGWIAEGRPVRRGPVRLPLERQVRLAAGTLAGLGGVLALAASPWFALAPIFVGVGLVVSGLTGNCGMALLLARLPYNRTASCDVAGMVQALTAGTPPAPAGRAGAAPAACCTTAR